MCTIAHYPKQEKTNNTTKRRKKHTADCPTGWAEKARHKKNNKRQHTQQKADTTKQVNHLVA